ncbi:hypothetical protein TNCV_4917121 [Trichonephila clavipes]|nr:hypothetical protein TNCV_4917121 [Trichonephila clavipes]
MPCGYYTLLQTALNGTSGHRTMCNRLNLFCYGSRCDCAIHLYHAHNLPTTWVRSVPSVRRFLLHLAMTEPLHGYLVSSNTLTDFSEEYSTIHIGYYSSSVEFKNLAKRT